MKKTIAVACWLLFAAGQVMAEGYQVNSQSTKQSGMGHVGTAMKLGAESMHFNPAGLGFLDKNVDLSLGMAGVFSSAEFTQAEGGYRHSSDNAPSTPLYFYAGFKVYDFLSAGVSLTTPYGSTLDWGANWKGSHLVQDISLKSFSIQPTVSVKITDRLSVGAGMMVMTGSFKLSRALLSSDELGAMAMLIPPLVPLAQKYKEITPVSVALSGNTGVRLGYNVGAMWDVSNKITIGASYRSKTVMKVDEGQAQVLYANEAELKPVLGSNVPPLDMGFFRAQLPLPSNLNVGITYTAGNGWLLSGDVQFVGWSAYQSLPVNFYPQAELGKYSLNPSKKYTDTRIYRIGAQMAATRRLDLRLGAYYDETPVKENFLNPETPSMDKLGLSAGLSFRPTESFSVDLAFYYTTGFGRTGSYSDKSAITGLDRRFEGHYDVSAFTPCLGLSYSFR